MVATAEEYRANAIVCERNAKEATDQSIKLQWKELAIQWHYIASQAARLSGETTQNGRLIFFGFLFDGVFRLCQPRLRHPDQRFSLFVRTYVCQSKALARIPDVDFPRRVHTAIHCC